MKWKIILILSLILVGQTHFAAAKTGYVFHAKATNKRAHIKHAPVRTHKHKKISLNKKRAAIAKRVNNKNGVTLAVASANTDPVPFVYQVVGSSWSDPIAADACEEASILMATEWATGKTFSPQESRDQIAAMSDYEQKRFGAYQDTSAADTAALMKEVYNVPSTVSYNLQPGDLKNTLLKGHIAITPINGQILNNPGYSKPGPTHHMIVVAAYDPATDEYLINDPGTRIGNGQRFAATTLQSALADYQTGNHIQTTNRPSAMIEVSKLEKGIVQ